MAIGKKTGGRVAGVPNKATTEARLAIAKFVDDNAHRLQAWLDEIAADKVDPETKAIVRFGDPEKAFSLFQSVIEYHVPKLARTEMTGDDGKDLFPTSVRIELVDATANPKGL